MEKDMHDKIQRLQLVEENLHNYLAQKQQVQSQLMELESATDALGSAKTAYQIVGGIMVERPKQAVADDVSQRMERVRTRLEAIEKQESRLKNEAEGLQKEIMQSVGKGEKND